MWIQTWVTVRKRLSWVVTSVTLTFDLWPWPFAWTLLWSLVIPPWNFMMIRWWEHSQKGMTDRRTDRRMDGQTENTICRVAWSQQKSFYNKIKQSRTLIFMWCFQDHVLLKLCPNIQMIPLNICHLCTLANKCTDTFHCVLLLKLISIFRARHLFIIQLGSRTTIKQYGLVRNRNLLGHDDSILPFSIKSRREMYICIFIFYFKITVWSTLSHNKSLVLFSRSCVFFLFLSISMLQGPGIHFKGYKNV